MDLHNSYFYPNIAFHQHHQQHVLHAPSLSGNAFLYEFTPKHSILLFTTAQVAKAEAEAAAAEAEVGEDGELLGPPQKIVKISPDVEIFQTTYYEFTGTLTTNLKNSRKFLQVGIGVSTQYDETVMENVDSHQLALRSEMLGVLSGFSVEQLQDKDGRQALLDQLRDVMNAKLEELEGFGGVEGVHFTSFVVQ